MGFSNRPSSPPPSTPPLLTEFLTVTAALPTGSGASPRTVERLFRAETGMSFGAWRQQLRLGRALELLARGDSVTAVAIESGYTGTSAFVAAFKASFGRTPGRYFD